MACINLIDQAFFKPEENFNLDTLLESTFLGLGVGAVVGASIDILEALSKHDVEVELSLKNKVWIKGKGFVFDLFDKMANAPPAIEKTTKKDENYSSKIGFPGVQLDFCF